MALNGYITAEERRSRLVMTASGFVVAVRQVPRPWPGVKTVATEYAIYREGELLAWLTKVGSKWSNGVLGGFKTRQEAIESALRSSIAPTLAGKAKAEYDARGVMVVGTAATRPPCTVCGTAYEKHGSYPTCASHPYSPDGRCGHVGIFADGRFTGVPCTGAECRNGCARAHGVSVLQDQTFPHQPPME